MLRFTRIPSAKRVGCTRRVEHREDRKAHEVIPPRACGDARHAFHIVAKASTASVAMRAHASGRSQRSSDSNASRR